MLAKECITGRWRFFLGTIIILLYVMLLDYAYLVALRLESRRGPPLGPLLDTSLAWIAAFLGAGLIAGEARTGTITFLLSRPLSRERVLLIKYGVSAGFLFAFAVLGQVFGTLPVSTRFDLEQPIWLLMLTLLFLNWLSALAFLGIGLVWSILCKSSLIAFVLTSPFLYGIWLIGWGRVDLPWGYIVLQSSESGLLRRIGHYWYFFGFDAQRFGSPSPLESLLTRLVVAAIVLGLALFLFRRKAY
jgi:ABC-2 type transport system permease protein